MIESCSGVIIIWPWNSLPGLFMIVGTHVLTMSPFSAPLQSYVKTFTGTEFLFVWKRLFLGLTVGIFNSSFLTTFCPEIRLSNREFSVLTPYLGSLGVPAGVRALPPPPLSEHRHFRTGQVVRTMHERLLGFDYENLEAVLIYSKGRLLYSKGQLYMRLFPHLLA